MTRPRLPVTARAPAPAGRSLPRVAVALVVAAALFGTYMAVQARIAPPPPAPAGSPRVERLRHLKLVSYFPARHGWQRMWTAWSPEEIDADFARLASLGANGVRIVLFPDTFGYPAPSAQMMTRLHDMVQLASSHGLQSVLTLFDQFGNWADIAGSTRWLDAVIRPYAGSQIIAFIELYNEVDPNESHAMGWVIRMLPHLRKVAGGIPVTVSTSDANGIEALASLKAQLTLSPPDFYSLHYFGTEGLAYSTFAQAKRTVAPAMLFLGEFGFPTAAREGARVGVPAEPADPAALEAYQAHYYRAVLWAAKALGVAAAPWMLNDFAPGAIPPGATASDARQYRFGLFRPYGSPKPAATALRSFYQANSIATTFNNGFETSAGDQPAEWLQWHAWQARFAWDPQVAHSGRGSARISSSGGDSTGVPAFYTTPIDPVVAPGTTYTASAWVRGFQASGWTRVALSWYDRSGRYIGQAESPVLPDGTTAWQPLTVSATAPAHAAYVQLHLKSSHNPGTIWFDDVAFSRKPPS
jgi:hypothetical protein